MNKGDLIDLVASNTGESRAGAARMVEAVLDSIVQGVNKDAKVSIAGFGTFKKKFRKARVCLNPSTKVPMQVQASTTIGFSPSETLRNGV